MELMQLVVTQLCLLFLSLCLCALQSCTVCSFVCMCVFYCPVQRDFEAACFLHAQVCLWLSEKEITGRERGSHLPSKVCCQVAK